MGKISSEEETWTNLTKEDRNELMANLIAWRSLKKTGARANNKAAAMDCIVTVGTLQTKVRTRIVELSVWLTFKHQFNRFHARHGTWGFAFFEGSNVHNVFVPTVIETPGTLDFIPVILGESVVEVLEWFKAYATLASSSECLMPLLQL